MSNIYFISDLHFGHDKAFLYEPRGFKSIKEHDEAIIERWNKVVGKDDIVYVLGDLCLGGEEGTKHIKEKIDRLNGMITIVTGNHDSPPRIEEYCKCKNVVSVCDGLKIKYGDRKFFLSHYPAITAGLEADPKTCEISLHGHLHTKNVFYEDRPNMYNVCCNAHNCTPVHIDTILEDFNKKVNECIKEL